MFVAVLVGCVGKFVSVADGRVSEPAFWSEGTITVGWGVSPGRVLQNERAVRSSVAIRKGVNLDRVKDTFISRSSRMIEPKIQGEYK